MDSLMITRTPIRRWLMDLISFLRSYWITWCWCDLIAVHWMDLLMISHGPTNFSPEPHLFELLGLEAWMGYCNLFIYWFTCARFLKFVCLVVRIVVLKWIRVSPSNLMRFIKYGSCPCLYHLPHAGVYIQVNPQGVQISLYYTYQHVKHVHTQVGPT